MMKIPLTPPPVGEITGKTALRTMAEPSPLVRGRYLHWDEVRHRTPPAGLDHKAWWGALKTSRRGMYKPLPFIDKYDKPMVFSTPDPVLRMLHDIDRSAAGSISMDTPVVSGGDRNRYLVSSLIEEAITSSQLEGAATTRKVAKAMLRDGRRPRDHSEQMILNNYRVMEAMRELRGRELTPALVMELHRMIALDTLEDPATVGRLRKHNERIHIAAADNTVLHDPPPAASLCDRLARLCKFANAQADDSVFVHPVVRAIVLHFMIGYDHPFVDGNGRTARALFYWSLARSNYWLMEYVSISRLLRRAPARYVRAYLHAETDDNDVTYFIIHQLRIIERAIVALQEYLKRKGAEQHDAEVLLRDTPSLSARLNHRQVALLGDALKHTDAMWTIESHRHSHRVTRQTARTDLLRLVELKLLVQTNRGRAFLFYAPEDLRTRISSSARRV